MAAKKSGLGKGLDALLMDNAMEEISPSSAVKLKIMDIEPNRGQPRKDFSDEALGELADSITKYGILQPLLVRPIGDNGYQLIAGERRWRAARLAGLTEVPVVVREMTDEEAAALALIENLQRESRQIPSDRGKRTAAFKAAGAGSRSRARRKTVRRTCTRAACLSG